MCVSVEMICVGCRTFMKCSATCSGVRDATEIFILFCVCTDVRSVAMTATQGIHSIS